MVQGQGEKAEMIKKMKLRDGTSVNLSKRNRVYCQGEYINISRLMS